MDIRNLAHNIRVSHLDKISWCKNIEMRRFETLDDPPLDLWEEAGEETQVCHSVWKTLIAIVKILYPTTVFDFENFIRNYLIFVIQKIIQL